MTTDILFRAGTVILLGIVWALCGYVLSTNTLIALVGASIYTAIILKD